MSPSVFSFFLLGFILLCCVSMCVVLCEYICMCVYVTTIPVLIINVIMGQHD